LRRKKQIIVLFQRYTGDTVIWAFSSRTLPIGGMRLNSKTCTSLHSWLDTGDIEDFFL
jgi:hypothetical protein